MTTKKPEPKPSNVKPTRPDRVVVVDDKGKRSEATLVLTTPVYSATVSLRCPVCGTVGSGAVCPVDGTAR